MIPSTPEQQEQVAKLVKERIVHLLAIKGFAERKKEVTADLKDKLGKDHGVDIEKLAKASIERDEIERKHQEGLADLEERVSELSVLDKYIKGGDNVHDLADEYMEVK